MPFFTVSNWLKSPNDRDIIKRWTPDSGATNSTDPANVAKNFRLELPPLFPDEPQAGADTWEFLAVGDTGDADSAGPEDSPQDAVGREMGRDAAAPVGPGAARLVVHTGDVIYMAGERRLYDRNFRRPYGPFLSKGSTVDDMIFRLPFLPVPGNHDYYDLGSWATWLSRVPLLGRGLRALTHKVFSFGLPQGGSDMGRAYMEAFVDLNADTRAATTTSLPYKLGERTKIPNRYYQYSVGGVDFFALDSNTLDAPAPETVDPAQVRRDANEHTAALEKKAAEIDTLLRREQRLRDAQQAAVRQQIGADTARRSALGVQADQIVTYLMGLKTVLADQKARRLADRADVAARHWTDGASDLRTADSAENAEMALRHLDEVSDDTCALLSEVEYILADLPKGDPARGQLLEQRDAIERSQTEWATATGLNTEVDAHLRRLSEEALDLQRELAQGKRRQSYRPDDHDRAQLEWLDQALTASERERPNAWRIVYLHHPLYTTINNRCERPDVQGVRANLMPILQRHDVHVVLAGHSHAFEWVRSSALPNAGLFVTGGGGQISLRPSLLEPRRLSRLRGYYGSLRAAGAQECVMAGHGPAGGDGDDGLLYHYLRISVTPETITVRPVGVRRLDDSTYRREEPMPVYHAPHLPPSRPRWEAHKLSAIIVRRDAPPRVLWE